MLGSHLRKILRIRIALRNCRKRHFLDDQGLLSADKLNLVLALFEIELIGFGNVTQLIFEVNSLPAGRLNNLGANLVMSVVLFRGPVIGINAGEHNIICAAERSFLVDDKFALNLNAAGSLSARIGIIRQSNVVESCFCNVDRKRGGTILFGYQNTGLAEHIGQFAVSCRFAQINLNVGRRIAGISVLCAVSGIGVRTAFTLNL